MRARRCIVVVFTAFAVAACSTDDPKPEPADEVSQALPKPPRCKAGFAECNDNTKQGDRCETNTNTNVNHCGGCGNVCTFANADATCSGGVCQMGACHAGFLDCDNNPATGCEANINTDEANCGSCGSACSQVSNANETCSGGTCSIASCDTGFANCDGSYANGCEADVSSDVQNCGSCGNACLAANANTACNAGACEITSCAPNFGNCDNVYATGCEENLTSQRSCGTCYSHCEQLFNMICCPGLNPTTGGGACFPGNTCP